MGAGRVRRARASARARDRRARLLMRERGIALDAPCATRRAHVEDIPRSSPSSSRQTARWCECGGAARRGATLAHGMTCRSGLAMCVGGGGGLAFSCARGGAGARRRRRAVGVVVCCWVGCSSSARRRCSRNTSAGCGTRRSRPTRRISSLRRPTTRHCSGTSHRARSVVDDMSRRVSQFVSICRAVGNAVCCVLCIMSRRTGSEPPSVRRGCWRCVVCRVEEERSRRFAEPTTTQSALTIAPPPRDGSRRTTTDDDAATRSSATTPATRSRSPRSRSTTRRARERRAAARRLGRGSSHRAGRDERAARDRRHRSEPTTALKRAARARTGERPAGRRPGV